MGNTKFHPLTGTPIVPLGYRNDGRAIWPVMGASDDPPPADPPQDPPADPPAEPPKDAADDGKGGKDAILADLAKERDKRQSIETQLAELKTAQQGQMDAIAKALGLKADDTPPDAEALTAQVRSEQAKAREAAVQLAVYRAPAAKSADVDGLLDSTSFQRTLADVDPNDAAAVDAAVKTFVDANPRFKAQAEDPFPTAGQAGIGVAGGGAAPASPRAADLAQIEADLRAAKRP